VPFGAVSCTARSDIVEALVANKRMNKGELALVIDMIEGSLEIEGLRIGDVRVAALEKKGSINIGKL